MVFTSHRGTDDDDHQSWRSDQRRDPDHHRYGDADVTAPGSTVTLFDNGGTTPIGSGIVQADGTWSIPNVTLAPGVNGLVAKDTDLAGDTGSSTAVVYTSSTTGPTVAIGSAGGPTNVATQTITGTVSADVTAPGSTVTLFDNGGTTPIGSAIVQADGSWTITNVTLAPGVNSLVAIRSGRQHWHQCGGCLHAEYHGADGAIAPVDGTNVINAANAAGGVALGGSISGIAANSTFNVTVTDGASIKTYAATVKGPAPPGARPSPPAMRPYSPTAPRPSPLR